MMTKNMEGPLATAVRLLARRDHSEWELRSKLKQRGFLPEEVDEALIRVKDEGYINDERMKTHAIEKLVREKHYGLHVIVGKLRSIGLTVSNTEVRSSFSVEEEWTVAEKIIEKQKVECNTESYPRLARLLNNRGFSQPILSRLSEKCLKPQ
jgi:regulatory protein